MGSIWTLGGGHKKSKQVGVYIPLHPPCYLWMYVYVNKIAFTSNKSVWVQWWFEPLFFGKKHNLFPRQPKNYISHVNSFLKMSDLLKIYCQVHCFSCAQTEVVTFVFIIGVWHRFGFKATIVSNFIILCYYSLPTTKTVALRHTVFPMKEGKNNRGMIAFSLKRNAIQVLQLLTMFHHVCALLTNHTL